MEKLLLKKEMKLIKSMATKNAQHEVLLKKAKEEQQQREDDKIDDMVFSDHGESVDY